MNLSNLSVADLRGLQENIKLELKKRDQQEIADAREKILAIAKSVGIPVRELMGNGVRTKSGPVAAQYRDPGDVSQQWSGRGRQPKWAKAWVDSGKSLDEARI